MPVCPPVTRATHRLLDARLTVGAQSQRRLAGAVAGLLPGPRVGAGPDVGCNTVPDSGSEGPRPESNRERQSGPGSAKRNTLEMI